MIIWKLLKNRLMRQYHVVSDGVHVVTVGLFPLVNAPSAPVARAVFPPPPSSGSVRVVGMRVVRRVFMFLLQEDGKQKIDG